MRHPNYGRTFPNSTDKDTCDLNHDMRKPQGPICTINLQTLMLKDVSNKVSDNVH